MKIIQNIETPIKAYVYPNFGDFLYIFTNEINKVNLEHKTDTYNNYLFDRQILHFCGILQNITKNLCTLPKELDNTELTTNFFIKFILLILLKRLRYLYGVEYREIFNKKLNYFTEIIAKIDLIYLIDLIIDTDLIDTDLFLKRDIILSFIKKYEEKHKKEEEKHRKQKELLYPQLKKIKLTDDATTHISITSSN